MKITRRFSKKIQIKQYEPIESSCEVEQEVGEEELRQQKSIPKYLSNISEDIDGFCQEEVEKTLANLLKEKDKEINKVARKKEMADIHMDARDEITDPEEIEAEKN